MYERNLGVGCQVRGCIAPVTRVHTGFRFRVTVIEGSEPISLLPILAAAMHTVRMAYLDLLGS